ncbi:Chondroitin sulfate N-acetylgalactosaminyltransferase 2 [Gracilariopsis chorda]|uniref:Chondroitin sulfate N-acetylgalactosaminyltransferase 2 n=1 Tax=Gracilariopsis chorda TaxID=448386 RepID=A0A2V3J2S9_9FLOR|nr:Chondroitin sulfate N-acetylgalactosaminyltransferase 2 [Gracilariopsis chorda]|eukprot:PXF48685.1 Chondroitin sulfate N-acetylgalactosaminyltransferase 2 [Gracilariopsis chorda]
MFFLCVALWLLPSPPALSDALEQDIHISSGFADQFESCYSTAPLQLIQFDRSQFSGGLYSGRELTTDKLDTFSTFFEKYIFQPNVGSVGDLRDPTKALAKDIHAILRTSQQVLRQHTGDRSLIIRNYTVGYSHLNARRGSRYILHLVSTSSTRTFRHDTVAIRRTLDGNCSISLRESPPAVFDKPMFVVVPYSKRPTRLEWFLDQFEKLHSEEVNARLILAHCNEDESDRKNVEKLVSRAKRRDYVQVSRIPFKRNSTFSRAVCIREAFKGVPDNNLVFISDIDMYIYPKMLESCRLNSIQGSQVYFPVFYSLYPGQERIEKGSGYWRTTSYGMSCIYKSDFDAVGAYYKAEDRFVGWGGEDLVLRDAFLNHANYELFRAVEPALRHKWHPKNCDRTLLSYQDCISIRFQQLGDPVFLGKVLMERDIDVQSIVAQHFDDDTTLESTFNSSSTRLTDIRPPNTVNEMTEERHANVHRTTKDEQN